MEAITALGIDAKLLLAQIINFTILLLVLRKFLYGPMVKMLEDRKEKISEGLENSEKAAKCLDTAKEEEKKIFDKAYKESKAILESAKKEANDKAVLILKKANYQADTIVKNARDESVKIKENALKEAKNEISAVVMAAVEKIVGEEVENSGEEKLTARAIKEL